MNISVEIFNPKKTFKRIFSDDVRKYAHTRLHAYCSPYVPMDSGALDQTVDITPDYVHYKSPYAHFQWEGTERNLKYSIDKHPLATSHWERAAMTAKGDRLAEDIETYIKRK